MSKNNYAVFICTHGRPYAQHTLKALRKQGYTGKIYLVVDDEDNTVEDLSYTAYEYDAKITMFRKEEYFQTMDKGTNANHRACILYAKGYCEDLAKNLDLDGFVIADDDITSFRFRYPDGEVLKSLRFAKQLDNILDAYFEYMLCSNISTTGFGFVSLFYTGVESLDYEKQLSYRIPYNFILRNTKHEVNWMSWFGEDVVTATYYNKLGHTWLVLPFVQQDILPLATQDGGMKITYTDNPSISRAMQNVMYLPSELGVFCHKGVFKATIKHDIAYPMIISSRFKK